MYTTVTKHSNKKGLAGQDERTLEGLKVLARIIAGRLQASQLVEMPLPETDQSAESGAAMSNPENDMGEAAQMHGG